MHIGEFKPISGHQLHQPMGIACDSNGRLLVVDTGNDKVKVFDRDGKFLSMIGKSGTGHGQFLKPRGVFVTINHPAYIVFLCATRRNMRRSSWIYLRRR